MTEQRDSSYTPLQRWLAAPNHAKWGLICAVGRGLLWGRCFDKHSIVIICPGVHIRKRFGRILLGRNITLVDGCELRLRGQRGALAELVIGDETTLGDRTLIAVSSSVHIGAQCMIGYDSSITDSSDPSLMLDRGPSPSDTPARVVIGDHVWIGSHCLILKGVTIGEWSVIGEGSVVRQDVEPHSIVLGNPARRVGWTEGWRR